MTHYHKTLSLLIFSLLLLPAAHADSAGVVINSAVTGSPGAYSYSYGIDNQTAVGILLFSLTATGDVGAIDSPLGWVSTTDILGPGETQVEWVSTDTQFDVPASGVLSGFSFTSDSGPGTVAFSTFDENFSEFDGQTTGPIASSVSTPEPSALVLLAISLGGLFVLRQARRSTFFKPR